MSALSKLFPLLVLFVLLGFFAFVGYAIYTIANDVADKTAKKMEKKHLNFTKDGLVVGVKERREEAYVDRTQRWVLPLGVSFCGVWRMLRWGWEVCSSRTQNRSLYSYFEWLLTYPFLRLSFIVKAWNFSTWPAYKSRYWNKDTPQQHQASHDQPGLHTRETSQARIPQGLQPRAP